MLLRKNLTDAMNALRRSRSLSITAFSEEVGISRSSMQALLNGTGNPRMDTVEHVAARLCLDPAVLLSGSLTRPQLDVAISLLRALDFFASFSDEEKEKFASLFLEMISMVKDD
ncbi:XRE family transcriptional regulator [Clostridiales bacterium]|nr:XRE family transcriptional regulator [Clostridiales bacterium]